ncbi:MAG: hypothetical protein QOI20_1646, partial [Acidimicrobiaceae bacterium]|nr:hypothetical protein [Acidimicrobiaceae bacterium]
ALAFEKACAPRFVLMRLVDLAGHNTNLALAVDGAALRLV